MYQILNDQFAKLENVNYKLCNVVHTYYQTRTSGVHSQSPHTVKPGPQEYTLNAHLLSDQDLWSTF